MNDFLLYTSEKVLQNMDDTPLNPLSFSIFVQIWPTEDPWYKLYLSESSFTLWYIRLVALISAPSRDREGGGGELHCEVVLTKLKLVNQIYKCKCGYTGITKLKPKIVNQEYE